MDFAQDFEYSTLTFYRENHGRQIYYSWSGDIWWTEAPGQPQKKLCSIIGMNATKVLLKPHPEYGEVGYRLNREIGLFCDPETKSILHYWQPTKDSPESPVVHIANRMVQGSLRERKIIIPQEQGCITKVNWMPWMKLGYGHRARLRYETTIARVESFEELDSKLVKLVREKLPIYEFTPDECDEPNITRILYFKKHFEAYVRGETFPIEETE